MIYVTGDTHGDYEKFLSRFRTIPLTKADTVVVCGDFGFVWDTPVHLYSLAKLSAKPFTIVFVDGNHENFELLYRYPVVEWNGGTAHKIAGNIYHLMRGQVFSIENKTFFAMGGAYSVDKETRVAGKSWWEQELPDAEAYRTAGKTLERFGYAVDYVLTHTLPKAAISCLGIVPDLHDAELTEYLEWLYGRLQFQKWFAGHFHVNQLVKEKIQILLDAVIPIAP